MICTVHKTASKLIPAGITKNPRTKADGSIVPAGTPYPAFWGCATMGCRAKQVEEGTMMANGPVSLPVKVATPTISKSEFEALVERVRRLEEFITGGG